MVPRLPASQKKAELQKLASLSKALTSLLPARRTVDFHFLSNRDMDRLRSELQSYRSFKGREARKISREEKVSVLSFPADPSFPVAPKTLRSLGEVCINLEFGAGDYAALAPLLIHGTLHLLGYRHDARRDMIEMEALEKKVWTALHRKPRPSSFRLSIRRVS